MEGNRAAGRQGLAVSEAPRRKANTHSRLDYHTLAPPLNAALRYKEEEREGKEGGGGRQKKNKD